LAKGYEYIFLINNDVLVGDGAVAAAVSVLVHGMPFSDLQFTIFMGCSGRRSGLTPVADESMLRFNRVSTNNALVVKLDGETKRSFRVFLPAFFAALS
jgi:hypothetical protein